MKWTDLNLLCFRLVFVYIYIYMTVYVVLVIYFLSRLWQWVSIRDVTPLLIQWVYISPMLTMNHVIVLSIEIMLLPYSLHLQWWVAVRRDITAECEWITRYMLNFFSNKINIFLICIFCILLHISDTILEIHYHKKDMNMLIFDNQYHDCWSPGDARSHGISRHFALNISYPAWEGLSLLCSSPSVYCPMSLCLLIHLLFRWQGLSL